MVVDARKITVENGMPVSHAWGAVYAQYQEDIDQVKQQGNELSVEKKLYVERLVNNAPVATTDNSRYGVGWQEIKSFHALRSVWIVRWISSN